VRSRRARGRGRRGTPRRQRRRRRLLRRRLWVWRFGWVRHQDAALRRLYRRRTLHRRVWRRWRLTRTDVPVRQHMSVARWMPTRIRDANFRFQWLRARFGVRNAVRPWWQWWHLLATLSASARVHFQGQPRVIAVRVSYRRRCRLLVFSQRFTGQLPVYLQQGKLKVA